MVSGVSVSLMRRRHRRNLMSKPVEIGTTLAVVAVFIAVLVAAGATGNEKLGTVGAIVVFILLSSGAGYLIAQNTYS